MTSGVYGTGAGISPYEVIEFVQEHASAEAKLVRGEMKAAQDRTALVKDIGDLASDLAGAKVSGDYTQAYKKLGAFMEKHSETWGGGSNDLCEMVSNLQAWSGGTLMQAGTYKQTSYPDAAGPWSSFGSSWDPGAAIDPNDKDQKAAIGGALDSFVQKLNDWKDKVSGDDKISMMALTSDAEDLKNVYGMGSNLNSKFDEITSHLISQIK